MVVAYDISDCMGGTKMINKRSDRRAIHYAIREANQYNVAMDHAVTYSESRTKAIAFSLADNKVYYVWLYDGSDELLVAVADRGEFKAL
jgi:hypothetical protein